MTCTLDTLPLSPLKIITSSTGQAFMFCDCSKSSRSWGNPGGRAYRLLRALIRWALTDFEGGVRWSELAQCFQRVSPSSFSLLKSSLATAILEWKNHKNEPDIYMCWIQYILIE
ncbi:uncharacterized protein LOC144283253 isoform X2 [Canis aureus]